MATTLSNHPQHCHVHLSRCCYTNAWLSHSKDDSVYVSASSVEYTLVISYSSQQSTSPCCSQPPHTIYLAFIVTSVMLCHGMHEDSPVPDTGAVRCEAILKTHTSWYRYNKNSNYSMCYPGEMTYGFTYLLDYKDNRDSVNRNNIVQGIICRPHPQ